MSSPGGKQRIPGGARLFFDARDEELLKIVADVTSKRPSLHGLKNLLYPYLHPRGIKELAAPRTLRIAYAVVRLLESLEVGTVDDRLRALRGVQDEVLHCTDSHLHRNTARVLLQLMKDLVRSPDRHRLFQLAHDFRAATSGKPRTIRRLLRRYHLLEMPEEWNQIAFDDHVHDSHTKGRKSPCHLIMDAWIKGIRHLTVIYYNHVPSEAAAELLEAAEIMGVEVRIGVELSARFHDRYVQLIWTPRGFSDAKDFLSFLADSHVRLFMAQGREVSAYQQRYVLSLLGQFNERHRFELEERYGIEIGALDEREFLAFVGSGQASLLHLGKFIHLRAEPLLRARVAALRAHEHDASGDERRRIDDLVGAIDGLDSEAIVERYLRPSRNPAIPDPHVPRDGPDVPGLLQLSPSALVDEVAKLRSGYRITLNLSNLRVEDVLELLYECKGAIGCLEIFNAKDYADGKSPEFAQIADLQRALNDTNVVALKRLIRGSIEQMEPGALAAARRERLREILRNIGALQSYYRNAPLQTRIGSDSSGHSRRFHGMGFVVRETLPRAAQREVERQPGSRFVVPVITPVVLRETHSSSSRWHWRRRPFVRGQGIAPVLGRIGRRRRDWVIAAPSSCVAERGNVLSLGGVHVERGNGYGPSSNGLPHLEGSWPYLNTSVKNALKILIGFAPAFATFALTKQWWVLAYFGAVIWFAITGLRNILQSVLGGGGLHRSPLLGWNSYVSWERVSDSLLFTGFSVPLLEYGIKTLLLERSFGITTASNPALLYTVMATANGIYIATHCAWRGLPRRAVVGNLFRSILSIPIAIAFNHTLALFLGAAGAVHAAASLQKWAAIISKTASDCVAGVIEGLADRHENVRTRLGDYAVKLRQLFDIHAKLELLYPETDVLEMLASPKQFIERIDAEARDLEKVVIINALDLFYFSLYQPRARSVLRSLVAAMSEEERKIFVRSQYVLRRKREITQLFVDGVVGKEFESALSLYLEYSSDYLDAIERLATIDTEEDARTRVEGSASGPTSAGSGDPAALSGSPEA